MKTVSKKVLFKGRVQGVGFRATTLEQSVRYDITGYVKNLEDGSVELLAEGKESEVDEFIADVSNEMKDKIESKDIQSTESLGYQDFRIEY